MTLHHDIVTHGIKGLLRIACRIDADQLDRVPLTGPLIVVVNHINSLEVPIIYTHMHPRPVTAFVKAETWDKPVLGPLARLWDAIPLRRGEADAGAFRQAFDALDRGQIVVVAPEGTRSGHGRLQRGLPGVVLLALKSGVPLLPMASHGAEDYAANLRRLQRSNFRIAVGDPFVLSPGGHRVDRHLRQRLADALMYRIAALLPPTQRGVYAGDPGELAALTAPAQLV